MIVGKNYKLLKKMKKVCLSLVVSLFIFACSENKLNDDFKIENINVDVSKMALNNSIISSYSDKNDFNEAFCKKINLMHAEILNEIKNSKEFDVVNLKLKAEQGRFIIEQIIFIDTKSNQVVKLIELVDSALIEVKKDQLSTRNGESSLFGRCPQGWSTVGSCSNFGGNTQACVGNHVSAYLSAQISSVGDCARVQVSVGTLTTTVCGQSC